MNTRYPCRRLALLVFLALAAVASSAPAAPTLSLADFFLQMIDLDRLPFLEDGIRCAQASSYDRRSRVDPETGEKIDWGANGDAGKYIEIDPETEEAVMADIKGPGCIYRIWSANPQGKIRFYIDGSETPSYEFDFKELFTGKTPPFVPPFVWARDDGGRASDSYFPIPFASSCKVTADRPHGQYYHIGYQTFPESWVVEPFHLPLTAKEQSILDRVARVLERCGNDPQPAGGLRVRDGIAELAPGEEVRFAAERGPGIVQEFRVKVPTGERPSRRTLWLTAHWDGERHPSIAAPLGDFFGAGFAPGPYESLPMSMTEAGFVSYWRMPFHRSAEFFLRNDGTKPTKVSYRVAIRPRRRLPVNTAFFHAKWRREPRGGTFDYSFLECEGRGRFVGATLYVDNVRGGWWGEGDEKFTVDGEAFPSTFGTGSEDYFGDAWGIRYFVNPYHGCPVTVGRAQSCYRWHITDFVPFTESFSATIENYAFEEPDPNDFASMAYWYQIEPHRDAFEDFPVQDRLALPVRIERNAQEAEVWYRDRENPEGVSFLSDDDVDSPLSSGYAVRFEGRTGDEFPFGITAPRSDRYVVEMGFGTGGERAAELKIAGDAAGDKVYLEEGETAATIALTGEAGAGESVTAVVDYIRIHPFLNFIRNWNIIGPFDNTDDIGRTTVYPPETGVDLDAVHTGTGDAEIRWSETRAGPDGKVDLLARMDPNENGIAYAHAVIVSPRAVAKSLLIGSDDGVKVWLNGEVVHVNQARRGAAVDQDTIELALREGRNDLLFKVDQGVGDWALYARIIDPDEELTFETGR